MVPGHPMMDPDLFTTPKTIGVAFFILHHSIGVALALMGLPTFVFRCLTLRTSEIFKTHVVTATTMGAHFTRLTSAIFVAWRTNFRTWNYSFRGNRPSTHHTGQMPPNMLLKVTSLTQKFTQLSFCHLAPWLAGSLTPGPVPM
jgi:hypothetical protein